jgi:hypothetical protein
LYAVHSLLEHVRPRVDGKLVSIMFEAAKIDE